MAYAILTREPELVSPYADALDALGFIAIAMPVTRIEPPHDSRALARAVAAGGYAAIVVASARAARALIVARGDAELPEVWAVGPATARELQAAGIAVHVPEHARDGEMLARALVSSRDLGGLRVLVPRAEGGREEAIAVLRAAGVVVDAVDAYRSVAVAGDEPLVTRARPLLASAANACIVFAPSQVAALDALVPLASIAAGFAAIGETTAGALRERGIQPRAIADAPTPEGIAKALRAVYPRRP